MSYTDQNLMPGETVVYRAHIHWLRYLWTGVWMFLSLITVPAAFAENGSAICLLFFALGAILGVAAFIDVKTSEFAVTNKRVILKQGFIRRTSVEVLLTKIESLHVDQGILGRIFGFGTIVPGSSGTKQGFHKIAAPMEFRKQVNLQIEASSLQQAAPQAAVR